MRLKKFRNVQPLTLPNEIFLLYDQTMIFSRGQPFGALATSSSAAALLHLLPPQLILPVLLPALSSHAYARVSSKVIGMTLVTLCHECSGRPWVLEREVEVVCSSGMSEGLASCVHRCSYNFTWFS